MSTLADVAKAAGVSKAAASLVLSGRSAGRVSAPTAELVRKAADKLGYVGNAVAASMRNGQTKTIGVIGENVLSTPYAVTMIDAVLSAAQEAGWSVLLTDSGQDEAATAEATRTMLSRQVRHVIYASMYHRPVEVTQHINHAVVLNGFDAKCVKTSTSAGAGTEAEIENCKQIASGVVPDELQGARDATQHLLDLGHTRIGFAGHSQPGVVAMKLRQRAYAETLTNAGITVDDSLIAVGSLDPQGADRVAHQLLDRSDRPTAIFCYNDALAAAIYRQARRLELNIPDDLSVVGFDDLALISTNLDPQLTTMRLPHKEMATWLTHQLISSCTNDLPAVTTFACPLIERRSTAPPRRRT